MKTTSLVSLHGGHSGQFCNHATDSLEDIIRCYIGKEFLFIGITEHSPAICEELLYPDQQEAGLTPESLLNNFANYITECRRLQEKYRSKIKVFTAIEIETYSGYEEFVPFLIDRFRPDYIVGSVHFVNDMMFDYSREYYQKAIDIAGDKITLYCQYFDQQYEMIRLLKPAVVGHFDLIRIYDPDYKKTLLQPKIMMRIKRNLQLIKDLGLIMDFNLYSLTKGADEPYISMAILQLALELGITVIPGDDSHGLDTVGANIDFGIDILQRLGFHTNWQEPKLLDYNL